ncbi:Rib/alpha-like domain-containing protein [Lactobacillus jensenii]|uniref:Rib/alpha-like domain-containing protein n=1 Tax=Lactobacillus jensenii TaxID=109790 RepID=UPI001190B040|nr:Rib/alpha-like domain-containing protein [Lactobacillus jensenii]MDK7162235.1 Rib/alpha-like domain-containing protein [Lactobacillus jensenii]TVV12522.1 YSIRK-type signal peptide-containing protein [Lactobacillus jensenii]
MFSKNNMKMRMQKVADKEQQHFALRKLNVGLVSVLMGTTLFFVGQTSIAKADTLESTKTSVTEISSSSNSNQEKLEQAKAVSSQEQTTSTEENVDSASSSQSKSENNSSSSAKSEVSTQDRTDSNDNATTNQVDTTQVSTTSLKAVQSSNQAANLLAESKVEDSTTANVSDFDSFNSALMNQNITTININSDFTSGNYGTNVEHRRVVPRTLVINGNGHTVDLGSIGYFMNPGGNQAADWTVENGTFYSKSAVGPFALTGDHGTDKAWQATNGAVHRMTYKDMTVYAGGGAYAANAEIDLEGTNNLNATASYQSKFSNGTVYTETGGNRSGVEGQWIIIKDNANVTVNTDHGQAISTEYSDGNHRIEVGENATLNGNYLYTTYGTPYGGGKIAVLSNGANGGTVIFHKGSKSHFTMPNQNVTGFGGNGFSNYGTGSVLYLGAANTTIEKGAEVTIDNPKEANNDNSIFIRSDGTQLNIFGNLIINDGARDYTIRADNRVSINVGQSIADDDYSNDNGKLIINRNGDFYLNNDGGALSMWGPITINVNSGAALEVYSTGINNVSGSGANPALMRVGGSSKLNVYKRGTFILSDSSNGKVSLVDDYNANGNFNFDNTAKVIFDISNNNNQNSRIFALNGTVYATHDKVRAMLTPSSNIADMGTFKTVQFNTSGQGGVTGDALHSEYQNQAYNNIVAIRDAIRTGQLRYLEFSTRSVNNASITGEGHGFTDNGAQIKGSVVDESTNTGAVAVAYDKDNNKVGSGNVDDQGNFTINLDKPLLNKEEVKVRIETPRGASGFVSTTAPLGPTAKSPITVAKDDNLAGQDASQYITNKDEIANIKPGTTDYEPTFKSAAWKSVDTNTKKGIITVTYADNTTTDLDVDLNVVDKITDADKFTPEGGTIKVDNGHKLDGNDAYEAIKNHDDLPADKAGYNWVVDENHPAVDTTKPGDQTGYVQVTYNDGSKSDLVPVTVHVIADNEKYTAIGKTQNLQKGQSANPQDFIANKDGEVSQDGKTYTKLPDGTKYEWVDGGIDTSTIGPKQAQVKVTYPDGTTQIVPVKANVYSDANLSTVVGKDINAGYKEDLTNRAIDKDKSTNLPTDPSAYTWVNGAPDTSKTGDIPATVKVTYPDGSYNTVDVTVHVTSDAEKYSPVPETISVPKGTDLSGRAKDGIANADKDANGKEKLPDGTKYEWDGGVPNTSVTNNKYGHVKVTYPDGSSTVVEVPLNITDNNKSDAEKHNPQANILHATLNQDLSSNDWAKKGILNADEQDGATFRWRKGYVPDTSKEGQVWGIVVVSYPDSSINEVRVPVIVQSDASKYGIETQEINVHEGTDISSDEWARKGILNADQAGKQNEQLPDGTSYTWANGNVPDTTKPNKKTGYVTVTFPDNSSRTVPVIVNVIGDGRSDAEKYQLKAHDIWTYINDTPVAEKAVSNLDELKDVSSITWATTPDVSKVGNVPAIVVVTYKDGTSNAAPINIEVKGLANDYKPEGTTIYAGLNEDITNRAADGIANKDQMPVANKPEGTVHTTYSWKDNIIPDTTKPGTKYGIVEVNFPDGSTKDVPVEVKVTSLASDYQNKIDTKQIIAKYKGNIPQASDGIANKDQATKEGDKDFPSLADVLAPNGIQWKKNFEPDLSKPGLTSGEAILTFKDGSTAEVTIPVLVQTDADRNTPETQTIKTLPGQTVNPEDGVINLHKPGENNPQLPDGTKVTFDNQSDVGDFTKHGMPGSDKSFDATVTYPDGTTDKIKLPVHITADNEVNTPITQGIITPKDSVPDANKGIANLKKATTKEGKTYPALPENTTVEWVNPGQMKTELENAKGGTTKNYDAVVIYPDKSTEIVSIPVTVATDADTYKVVTQPIDLKDRNLPDNADDGITNLHKPADFKTPQLPDGTHAEWQDKDAAQEVVKNLKPGETVKLPATVVFPDGSKKGEGIDVSVHLHGQSDDYNIETQPVNTDKDGNLPENADSGIKNLGKLPEGTHASWGDGAQDIAKNLKPGETKDVPATVVFPDGSKKEITIPVHREGQSDGYDVEPQLVNTDKNGQLPNAKEGIKNLADLPEGTNPTWADRAQDKINKTKPGTDTTAQVVVTFPDGSTKEVTVPVHKHGQSDDYGDKIVTQRVETDSHGQLPENADSGIKNLGDLPEGTHAVWGQGAQTIVDGMKPGETKDVPATIEFPDGSTKDVTIPVYKTSTRDQGTLNPPTDKVPVDDTKHITDEDKGKVIDNVKKSNPGKDITDAHVDDDGTFHGKVDGQDVVVPGTETVVEKQKESLNPPTDKVPVDDTKHITDEDKGKVIDNVKKSNPDKDITDAHVDDDGTFHGKVDGQDVVIPGTETVVEKQKESLNPPTDKVPVDDTKHITDEDKGKVIDNVKKSNPDKDITDAHVDDDGTFHGKVDGQDVVIPGIETVVEKSTNNQKSDTNKGLISNDNSEKNSHMINANVNTKSRNSLSAKQNRLPQTGSETSGLSALGLAMLSLVGLGFLIKKRKED